MSICMYVPCVWNHEKWDPMMACSSNPLYEYVNIFLNGYILAKHYFDVITSFFSGYILAVGRVRREINDVTAACPI